MTWEDRMAQCTEWQQHCESPVPAEWPWQQLEALADKLYAELEAGVAQIMSTAGEHGEELADVRRGQVAHSIGSRARRQS